MVGFIWCGVGQWRTASGSGRQKSASSVTFRKSQQSGKVRTGARVMVESILFLFLTDEILAPLSKANSTLRLSSGRAGSPPSDLSTPQQSSLPLDPLLSGDGFLALFASSGFVSRVESQKAGK